MLVASVIEVILGWRLIRRRSDDAVAGWFCERAGWGRSGFGCTPGAAASPVLFYLKIVE